ncbi:MAG: Gldg family protein [Deltaproteobacteria bacterium]|nr:Gldg family protein [Deltaproteobacteria bacterium]
MAESKSPNNAARSGKTDALVMVLATVGVAVVVNALMTQTNVRLDLTEQKVHTLSDASITAVQGLDSLVITAYVSKKLPETIPMPGGGKMALKGIERAFRDKLQEYVTASGGKVKLVYADDNSPGVGTVEEQAEAAKLEAFSSSEAQLAGSELKFARYAMGATFHYKTVHEVFPKALQPGFYEFEITKILLRLREKYEAAQVQKEPLAQGKAIFEAIKACNEFVQKKAKVEENKDEGAAGLSLKGSTDPGQKRFDALVAVKDDIAKTCAEIGKAAGAATKLKGKSQFGDQLLQSADQYKSIVEELGQFLSGTAEGAKDKPKQAAMAISQLTSMMDEFFKEVDRAHTNLTDSPGRKVIGFLCGHDEFCPFAEADPFVPEQMAMMMGQNNPMMKQIMQAATQIAQSIDETNARIGDNLFTKRGYAIRRVDGDEPIPAEVSALIVYAPRKALPEYARYQLDQFLLAGKPVIAFAQEWEVALMNMAAPDDLGNDVRLDYSALSATASNLQDVLKGYGVDLKRELTLDSKHVETVRVMKLVQRGGLQFQTQQDFPYALVPVATKFDHTHPLSKALETLPVPYPTSVEPSAELEKNKEFEVVKVIQSSESSVRKPAPLPVLPPALKEVALKATPTGPHTLALYVRGPFHSQFAGKDPPKRPEKKQASDPMHPPRDKPSEHDQEIAKRTFKAQGAGKLLVVASNLGIEGLSRAAVLKGFEVGKMAQFSADTLKDYQTWNSNFQNWQIRIGQVSHLLGDNLQFIANVMDWATAHEALVEIRSKGDMRRPLRQMEPDEAKNLRMGSLLAGPVLLALAGALRMMWRRKRNEALKA